MPVLVTFDVISPSSRELNRIRGAFEKLGWEHLGNTAHRYPTLHRQGEREDRFNHVIPALMMLRAFARSIAPSGRGLRRFTIDAHSSTGYNSGTGVGEPPLAAEDITCSQASASGLAFAQSRLEAWLDGVHWPYPPAPVAEGA